MTDSAEGVVMPVISQQEAVERMTRQVEQFPWDELVEVYNELFPKERRTEAEACANPAPLVERLVAYLNSGLTIDWIVELWNLIFTIRTRNVGWDEETEGLYYEEAEAVPAE